MIVGGPFFDELHVGQRFEQAPAMTLTAAAAAAHQAIVGDRLRMPLDATLSRAVLGEEAVLAHPALVWDIAIGQSTVATQRVIANLFYRGLAFRRAPVIGDTLRTVTEVVALRQTSRRDTGLAALEITTVDQHDRPVLDFWRCAMLPLREAGGDTGHNDDLASIGVELDDAALRSCWSGWRLDAHPRVGELAAGAELELASGDVVSNAPELARLSLNVAMAHHDATVSGRRLVYGGHTIGVAAAQATRALPDLVTIVGWHGCDHTAPVFEGDTLRSRLVVERRDGPLVHLRSLVDATRADGDAVEQVLDWRFVGVMA